jgi:CheY-like chemotaxis protein
MEAPLKKNILVVDDDADIRDTLAQVLEDEGYRVVCASNGLEALEMLRSDPAIPALILLDLMMPVMNGWQFNEERRKDDRLARIPLVVVTAAGDARDRAASIKAVRIIQKPIRLEDLLEVIQSAID